MGENIKKVINIFFSIAFMLNMCAICESLEGTTKFPQKWIVFNIVYIGYIHKYIYRPLI